MNYRYKLHNNNNKKKTRGLRKNNQPKIDIVSIGCLFKFWKTSCPFGEEVIQVIFQNT